MAQAGAGRPDDRAGRPRRHARPDRRPLPPGGPRRRPGAGRPGRGRELRRGGRSGPRGGGRRCPPAPGSAAGAGTRTTGRSTAFPTHEALSAAVPDHPVWLTRIDGHAALLNAPGHGGAGDRRRHRGPVRRPLPARRRGPSRPACWSTARWRSPRAASPGPGTEERRRQLARRRRARRRRRPDHGHRHGRGRRDDRRLPGAPGRRRAAAARRPLPDRRRRPARPLVRRRTGDRARSGGCTCAASRCTPTAPWAAAGAALVEPYSDDPGNLGPADHRRGAHRARSPRRALDAGFQVGVHAIGDRGNLVVLDGLEAAFGGEPRPEARFRLEHAQVMRLQDIARAPVWG